MIYWKAVAEEEEELRSQERTLKSTFCSLAQWFRDEREEFVGRENQRIEP